MISISYAMITFKEKMHNNIVQIVDLAYSWYVYLCKFQSETSNGLFIRLCLIVCDTLIWYLENAIARKKMQ